MSDPKPRVGEPVKYNTFTWTVRSVYLDGSGEWRAAIDRDDFGLITSTAPVDHLVRLEARGE